MNAAGGGHEAAPLPRCASAELAGWGRFPIETCDVYRPEHMDELAAIVGRAPQASLIARGLGRSYGDASLNGGAGVVLARAFDRMLAFDSETGVLHCEAAVSLADIIQHLLPRGFFFPVTPGTKYITVGGAIAADVHGKNHHRSGSMSAFVLDFDLLTGKGEVLRCSREEHADVFWATVGGMGLTGVILGARLQLRRVETAYMRTSTERATDLDDVLQRMEARDDQYDYAVAWIDCLGRGGTLGRSVLHHANHLGRGELPESLRAAPLVTPRKRGLAVPFTLPNATLNAFTTRAINEVYYRAHPTREAVVDCDRFFYILDVVQHWNRGYGRRGVLQYQALLPPDTSRAGLIALLEKLSASRRASFLAVLKSCGAASGGLLSFPRPGFTLALDLPNTGSDAHALLAELDAIVLRNGGSVYLAKDACLDAETFRAMYPGLERFRAVKAAIDPEQRFSSSLARRLEIVESG